MALLYVELLSADAQLPTKAHDSDAGYDLFASACVNIPAHGSALVTTAIKLDIPDGYYGRIASRSGLAVKHNLEVGAGVIDNGYHGEIMVLLRNHGNAVYTVVPGDKIAQIILEPYASVQVRQVSSVDSIRETSRKENGFGSSGK
jgi:dUTP pyrophosphatase